MIQEIDVRNFDLEIEKKLPLKKPKNLNGVMN